ncbi:MAG TPA: V4R domain-containing protein [Methanospirillum sp.]|nr:V4R domain-containing protein [Methanospirillum sp.]
MSSGDRSDENGSVKDIRLYSTQKRVIAIDSPIKIKILDLIADGDVGFDEIVQQTGKAKSTISVHLHDMAESGVIASRTDPDDGRKRLVTLISDPIGRLTNEDRDATRTEKGDPEEMPFIPGDVSSLFQWGVRIFRTEAMQLGINIDPVLTRTGERIGMILAPLVSNDDLEVMVGNMDTFWQQYSLGSIALIEKDPITLIVDGCFECEDLPVTGHSACAFDIGILTAIFGYHLKTRVQAVEEECYSTGYNHCRFVITKKGTAGQDETPGLPHSSG